MLKGEISASSFPDLLGSLASKRKNGILHIVRGEDTLSLVMFQSKVVEVLEGGIAPAAEVYDTLVVLGFAPDSDIPIDRYSTIMERGVPIDILRRAVRQRIFDKVFNLDFGDEAHYRFDQLIPDFDRDISPAIPASQYALEFVSRQGEAERFATIFEDGFLVRRGDARLDDLSDDENSVIDALPDEPISPEDLHPLTLLPTYYFHRALADLFEGGAIVIVESTHFPLPVSSEEGNAPHPERPVPSEAPRVEKSPPIEVMVPPTLMSSEGASKNRKREFPIDLLFLVIAALLMIIVWNAHPTI